MQVIVRIGALVLALNLTDTAAGQGVPYSAVVTQPEADVRCLPGTKDGAYVTIRLEGGQRVEVLKEREDGWLEIKPPEGSFSWINTRYVSQVVANVPNYVVEANPGVGVPVLMGSKLLNHRPGVVGAKLQRGTQLRAIGRPLADNEGTWLPVESPPSEVRYLRAEAIGRVPPAQAVTPPPAPQPAPMVAARVASSPGTGPLGSFQDPTQAGSALAPLADVDGLWRRAIQAERAGNVGEAIRLYTQVGNESAAGNRQLAIDAYNRAHFLREANRYPGSVFYPQEPRAQSQEPRGGSGLSALRSGLPAAVHLTAPVGGTAFSRPANSRDAHGTPSSGPGRLRVANRFLVANQRLYVLQNGEGLPIVYAAPQPGIDLEPYLGRNVELFGPTYYQGALRANYMSVLRVVLLD